MQFLPNRTCAYTDSSQHRAWLIKHLKTIMITVRPYGHSPDITLHWVTRSWLSDIVLKGEINRLPFKEVLEALIYKLTVNIINKGLPFGNKKMQSNRE